MVRLIASDIDGTLLQNGETQISSRFFEQAARLMDNGVAVCAASGRQYQSLKKLFAQEADRMYFLCENGAVVYGPGEQLLFKQVMPWDKSMALSRDILSIPGCEILISGVNTSYLCPKQDSYVNHIQNFLGNKIAILSRLEEMPEDFVKISAFYPDAAALEPDIRPRWEQDFSVAIAGKDWLDFTLADKGTGIRALCRNLGIPKEEAMAFGDNYNDIPMLDTVGIPYLMTSAVEPLRKKYTRQCRRVEDVLEQF